MINHILLALLVLFLLDVHLQSIGSLSGKRSRTDTDMQPELKVQRLQVVTSPQKVTQQLVEGNYRCFDSVSGYRSVHHRKDTVPYNFPFL